MVSTYLIPVGKVDTETLAIIITKTKVTATAWKAEAVTVTVTTKEDAYGNMEVAKTERGGQVERFCQDTQT